MIRHHDHDDDERLNEQIGSHVWVTATSGASTIPESPAIAAPRAKTSNERPVHVDPEDVDDHRVVDARPHDQADAGPEQDE